MFRYLLLAVFLPAILAVDIRECGGGLPAPTSATVAGCAASPCHTANGQTESVTITFNSGVAGATLANTIYSIAFGVQTAVPISAPYDSVCTSGGSCPVTAGQTITVTLSLNIVTEATGGVPMAIRFYATNPAGDVATCGETDFIID